MVNSNKSEEIVEILKEVKDPEIPVLNIVEMGIVRDVHLSADGHVRVDITPTYSGCPAMKAIEDEVKNILGERGYHKIEVKIVYAPAWTTDWLGEEAKRKLKEFGIAPPQCSSGEELVKLSTRQTCPYCSSRNTELRSDFSSTACKAMYYCKGCHQPFEYMKAI